MPSVFLQENKNGRDARQRIGPAADESSAFDL